MIRQNQLALPAQNPRKHIKREPIPVNQSKIRFIHKTIQKITAQNYIAAIIS